jgi:hypothetical protein
MSIPLHSRKPDVYVYMQVHAVFIPQMYTV